VRRTLAWFVVILTGLLLQSTLFAPPNGFTLAGARPELMYLITIVMAMLEGPGSGAVAGFAGGMAEDFLLDLRGKGSTALTLTLLGYVIGQLRQYIVTPSPLLPVILVAGGTLGGELFNGLVRFLLGQLNVTALYLVRTALLSAAYNALLTPIFYPVIRRAAEASRTRRVTRW
jgi:rod shape-determining protein MreD